MAKVIRTRWVYRKDNRWWRYLPRRIDGPKPWDYEANEGTIRHFAQECQEEMEDVKPSKLWMAWIYRAPSGDPKWTKKKLADIFGENYEVGRMEVLPNTAAINEQLWHVKHLIELRPITFPNGEPTEQDIYGTTLHPDGRCEVVKGVNPESAEEQLKLFDEQKEWPKYKLNRQLDSKYGKFRDVFETNVYTNKNVSIVK